MGIPRKHYKGKLNPSQAAEGISAARQNAEGLLSTAKHLLETGDYPRAAALAILSIEEAGKPPIIREILLAETGNELKVAWQRYRRHTSKSILWILPQLIKSGSRIVDDFRTIWDSESDHPKFIEGVKQMALYSDVYDDCEWSVPASIIEPQFAEELVRIADLLMSRGPSAMSTRPELEIWIKHMRPVWSEGTLEDLKRAFSDCFREAHQAGVLTGSVNVDDMGDFVNLRV